MRGEVELIRDGKKDLFLTMYTLIWHSLVLSKTIFETESFKNGIPNA